MDNQVMTDEEISEMFGDLNEDGSDTKIEEWEVMDAHLADRGMSEEERRELWRSLNPMTPLYDMYDLLRSQGVSHGRAQKIVKEVYGEPATD